jgi:hypothetical protein
MSARLLYILLALLALAAASHANVVRAGTSVLHSAASDELSELYPLVADTVDPTIAQFTVQGNYLDGKITLAFADPNTVCVTNPPLSSTPGTQECGEQVLNVTVVASTSESNLFFSNLQLVSLTNYPSAQATGSAVNATLSGFWDLDGVAVMKLGYCFIAVPAKYGGVIRSAVCVSSTFYFQFGGSDLFHPEQPIAFTGYISSYGLAYLLDTQAPSLAATPYELVAGPLQAFSSSANPFVLQSSHNISPYAATVNATAPLAPYYVSCQFSGLTISSLSISGQASCRTANLGLYTVSGSYLGAYVNVEGSNIYETNGRLTDAVGLVYALPKLTLIVTQ